MSSLITHTHTHIIQHTPLSPYCRHLRLDICSCAHFAVYPNQSCFCITPSPGDKPPEQGRVVRINTGSKQNGSGISLIYIYTRAIHSFLSFVFCCTAYTVIRAHGHLHTIHPPSLSLPCLLERPTTLTYFCYQLPSSHMVFIHYHSVSRRSQYSLIRSTCQLLFYISSSMHLFILNIIHS